MLSEEPARLYIKKQNSSYAQYTLPIDLDDDKCRAREPRCFVWALKIIEYNILRENQLHFEKLKVKFVLYKIYVTH